MTVSDPGQPLSDRGREDPDLYKCAPLRGQLRRARKAAVLTRFWQDVEQYRLVPLREVSTNTRSHPGAVQTPSRSAPELPSTTARPVAQPAAHPFGSELSAA